MKLIMQYKLQYLAHVDWVGVLMSAVMLYFCWGDAVWYTQVALVMCGAFIWSAFFVAPIKMELEELLEVLNQIKTERGA